MKTKREKIIFHEPEGCPQVTAVEAVDICNRFPRHVHSSYIFTLIDQGKRKVEFADGSAVFSAGEMCILPPGTSHQCRSISGDEFGAHSYRALCVGSDYMKKLACEITGKPCPPPDFPSRKPHRQFKREFFDDFFQLLQESDALLERETALTGFLYNAVINLSSGIFEPERIGPQQQALERIAGYIHNNFRESITLGALSDCGCISPFHLQKLFVRHYGVSPQEMVVSCRIKAAEQLLRNGCSLSATAAQCGFSDQSHFSRHFKRMTGVSPGRFVKVNQHESRNNK